MELKYGNRSQVVLDSGGRAMFILIPWKPVALVLGLLSALIFMSYFGSALIHGRDPFAVNAAHWRQPAQHVSGHASTTHKAAEKQPAETAN
jgi:hypothetical protein